MDVWKFRLARSRFFSLKKSNRAFILKMHIELEFNPRTFACGDYVFFFCPHYSAFFIFSWRNLLNSLAKILENVYIRN